MTTQAQRATGPGAALKQTGRCGTFAGVFTPNVLTILGLILFLRIGWVVGQSGLVGALIIIALANVISLLTGLSLSAVATSMEVKAGGKYYMISRSLGLEIGGAIGIPLYLSQAISIAFYIIGFTEALISVPYFATMDPRLISTVVALIFGVIAFVGADFALKIQYFILAILIASLISFFAGGWGNFTTPVWTANYTDGANFWLVFAVFFPAVTGIAVGASLSGDLKDPSKSIPQGTLASIAVTAVIYLAAAIWFAFHLPPDILIQDNLAMQRVAVIPGLILAGVWASTLSSALGSILAAPRTLQAIAKDRIAPRWMAGQLRSPTEPRMAVLITSAIAIGVIWMGDLNFVAPIITMFFLNTYGMINLVAGIEKMVGNPSFRPRFKIPSYLSILGAVGCYGAMFLINVPATIVAIVISYGIYFLLQRRQLERTWGDVRSGIWFAISRYALLNLEGTRWDAKNWRPNIIVFTGQPYNREQLVQLAEWLSLGHGIVTFFQFIVGNVEALGNRGLRETARKHIRSYIKDRRMTAFAEAEIVSDFKAGALTVVQAHGIGSLESNAVLMGWSGTLAGQQAQLDLTRSLVALNKSVLFLHYDQERGFGRRKIINVWSRGRGRNSDLMLLLAHIIRQHHLWEDATIRLLRVITSHDGVAQTRASMEQLLESVRVGAEPTVIVRPDSTKPVADLMAEWSRDADITLLGMQLPTVDQTEAYSERLAEFVTSIGSVVFVRSGQREDDLLRG
ncbi:MAG: amino acid permease [Anaerolineae bacterium]|nr:amino acid permease [Anaerolineae bacterium]